DVQRHFHLLLAQPLLGVASDGREKGAECEGMHEHPDEGADLGSLFYDGLDHVGALAGVSGVDVEEHSVAASRLDVLADRLYVGHRGAHVQVNAEDVEAGACELPGCRASHAARSAKNQRPTLALRAHPDFSSSLSLAVDTATDSGSVITPFVSIMRSAKALPSDLPS